MEALISTNSKTFEQGRLFRVDNARQQRNGRGERSSKIIKLTKSVAPKSIVHSDGVQALMKVKVNLMNLGVDMYSVSAHKVHAPRGVGGLYIRKGVRINPIILGGGQEKGLRSATENLAGIVAFQNS